MDKVAQRVALIAGASGGIGSAVARHLASSGVMVYLGYHRHRSAAEETAQTILVSGGQATVTALDLGDKDRADAVCSEIYERAGRLDILVNCAAVNREAPALAMDDAAWSETTAVNLDGAFRLTRAAARYMMLGRWGRIIQVSSIAAIHGGRGQINYATAKAGVEAMTRVLALELGRKGVLVNCVAPGVIETEMSVRVRQQYGEEILKTISLKRFGRPDEIASLIAFLASEDASYINGQTIRIDGGMAL
jgi:3-oxoacyl-[acyl-carrier protein] reductase